MSATTTIDVSSIEHFLHLLRPHQADLTVRYHIASLALFGSFVRGEQHRDSDLDVLATFTETPSLFTIIALEQELTDLLDIPVDVVLAQTLKPAIRDRVCKDLVLV